MSIDCVGKTSSPDDGLVGPCRMPLKFSHQSSHFLSLSFFYSFFLFSFLFLFLFLFLCQSICCGTRHLCVQSVLSSAWQRSVFLSDHFLCFWPRFTFDEVSRSWTIVSTVNFGELGGRLLIVCRGQKSTFWR